MKLTEQHEKAIAKRIEGYDRSMHCAHDSRELSEHFESGAEWGIEQFGGIQWNKYPENKPTEDGYYLVVDFSGRLVQWTWLGVSTGMEWQDITHWAHINLPNQ